jgi:hypothetical protein
MKTGRGHYLKSVILSLSILSLVGCASSYKVADVQEVHDIPNDCKNRHLMISWLENQLQYDKPYSESQREYDAKISAIKTKIWTLRTMCQPV